MTELDWLRWCVGAQLLFTVGMSVGIVVYYLERLGPAGLATHVLPLGASYCGLMVLALARYLDWPWVRERDATFRIIFVGLGDLGLILLLLRERFAWMHFTATRRPGAAKVAGRDG